MASGSDQRICGVWNRGASCVYTPRHDGPHTNTDQQDIRRLTAALADMTAERDWERRQKLDLVAVGQAFVDEINRLFSERNANTAALATSESRVAELEASLRAVDSLVSSGICVVGHKGKTRYLGLIGRTVRVAAPGAGDQGED